MTLTEQDINAIKSAFEPQFEKISRQVLDVNQRVDNLTNKFEQFEHTCNKRFIAIELRLDTIEHRLDYHGYLRPPMKKSP